MLKLHTYRLVIFGSIRRSAILVLLVLFNVTLGKSASLPLQSQPTQAPAPPKVLLGDTSADVGLVDALTQPIATHTFTLTNPTASPIIIDSVRGTCGCEHFQLTIDGKVLKGGTLDAGKSATVKFDVDLKGQPATELSKAAFVVSGAGNVLNTLTLSFKPRQPYVVQPPHLDIGDVSSNQAKSATVTVQIDESMLPTGEFPAFVTDTAGITAKRVGEPRKTERDGKQTISTDYLVSVDHPNVMGPFAAMLSFNLATPSKTVDTVYLPVSGTVVGDFSASPKAINFGVVASGVDTTRELILTGSSSDKLRAVKFVSVSPWVSGEIVPNASGGNTSVCNVSVTLSGKAPSGILKTSIVLTTGPDQSLTIPVSANVVGAQ